MRYFAEIAYNGSEYAGWQRQPKQISVQQVIEEAFSTILGTAVEVTGCGRTDAGVHASQYFLHFDYEGSFPHKLVNRLNKMLPKDIAIYRIFETPPAAHARFDAYQRSYVYHLSFEKNPFAIQTAYFYPYSQKPNFELMQQAAQLLLAYREFYPFCKTGHDAATLHCALSRSEWIQTDDKKMDFHISANRFLRGMVRLVVGMCLNVGLEKIAIADVKHALDQQSPLKKSWSVPPEGLFLSEVKYPFL